VVIRFACLFLLLLLTGCSGLHPEVPRRLQDLTINEDTTWSGDIVIDGKVRVVGGATLRIAPGTRISFVRRDRDQDGLGDAGIEVEHASLLALGSETAPIVFRSAEKRPVPGDWLELKVDFARRLQLSHCLIRDSAHGLHAHFSRGVIEDSVLKGNIDGTRFGQGRFSVRRCLVVGNRGKGLNFRNSEVEIVGNILRGNRVGLFIFETDRKLTVSGNNFVANGHHVRLGDFFQGDVTLGKNWFGSADSHRVSQLLYDRGEDDSIGNIKADLAAGWMPGTGPRKAPVTFRETTALVGEGFFDASAVSDGRLAFLPGWDGYAYAFDRNGSLAWKIALKEVADATPALDGDRLYLQTWGREVLALDLRDGHILWHFNYPESPHDDHRQGGLVPAGRQLLVPAWNGRLYALDAANGELLWEYDCQAPLRSAPLIAHGRIFQASGSGRLSILSLAGELLHEVNFGAPLLSTPLETTAGVVLVSRAGELVALDDSGVPRWRRALDEPCYYGAPVAADGLLFLATADGRLHCLLLVTGEPLWTVALSGASYATPLLRAGRIFVADNSGTLQVFNAESGERLGQATFDEAVQSTPLPFGDQLVLGGRDGRIHLLRLQRD